MNSRNLLILNGDLPIFPGRAGHEYLHTTGLAKLADKVGLVSMVHQREQEQKKLGLIETGVKLYLWESPELDRAPVVQVIQSSSLRHFGRVIYDFIRALPWRPGDTLIQDLGFRNMSGPLFRALSEDYWPARIVIQSSSAHWLDYLPPGLVNVLVLHDVRALMYERRVQTTDSWRERLGYRLEAWKYRQFEGHYCRQYDLVITVSAADEAWVRKNYRPRRIVTVPIPVDNSYFTPVPNSTIAPARVVFTGMMNHPPNVDAACFFARKVFPQVKAAVPEAEFWIVGREPAPEVLSLSELPGVRVTGFVPDIRPYIAEATVLVVPLRFGAGMRNKILEAWGMQKCIISTRIGAEGLTYENGSNILIADDAETLAARTVEVLHNSGLREHLQQQGRELIINRHNPARLTRDYYENVAAVISEKDKQNHPMRVTIDLRWMYPGVAGGIENLSRSFIQHLKRLDSFNLYTLLLPSEVKYDFDLHHHPNFQVKLTDGPAYYWHRWLWRGARFLHGRFRVDYWRSDEVEILRRARDLKADIALSIPGYIHLDLYPLLNVLVVPDIQHEYHPEFFSTQHLEERRRIYTDSIRRAAHLCAISEFTRQTLIDRLDIPPERVTTTHLAADPLFEPQSNYRGNPSPVLEKYNLPAGEYLLFPANTWRHKNHQAALHALHLLKQLDHLQPLLVCTGAPKEAQADLLELTQELHLEKQVRFLGYCPTTDMPALYEGAAAMVFPSLFEGFGIPILEAMWCDCPIVCSNTTSLPELAGPAALLIDPNSPEELADAMNRVLTDNELRLALIERGRQQVQQFSWHQFATKIVSILYQVLHYR